MTNTIIIQVKSKSFKKWIQREMKGGRIKIINNIKSNKSEATSVKK